MDREEIERRLRNGRKAEIILDSAIEFLAMKHRVSKRTIVDKILAKNEKLCDQLAILITRGIEAAR